MNAMTKNVTSAVERDGVLAAHFFVRGKLVQRPEVTHRSRDLGASFTTPAIDFDGLIQPRSERPPLLDVKVSEIVDFLVAVGERLRLDSNPYLQESLERVAATIPLPDRILERMFDRARLFMTHETLKTVNVVHVPSLEAAVKYVNVATQTIGVYPPERKAGLRDKLASAGGQRLVRLGSAAKHVMGGTHDAMFPMQRLVHWMSDEDA